MADRFKKMFKNKEKGEEGGDAPEPEVKEAPKKVTKDDFESLEVLGKGTFAHVVLARHISTGKYYAMKVVNKQGLLDSKRVEDVFTERNILTRSTHPYLLKLYYTFQSNHKLFFVMDYMPGGDLDKHLNRQPNKTVPPETAKLYAMEIFLAISYLHENDVVYRDLKPENILLDREGHCVLADFGLSKDFKKKDTDNDKEKDMRCNSFVGSPFYVAPDVLKQKAYTSAVDLWSFGVLLYRMLCSRPPFSGRNMTEVFDSILFSELRFPSSVTISPEARDLISKLLVKDAKKRIQVPEIRAHPFWNGLSFDDVMQKKVKPQGWTVLPTVEEMLAARAQGKKGATGTTKTPGQIVNTPANSTSLQQDDQNMFTGFSCAADNVLK